MMQRIWRPAAAVLLATLVTFVLPGCQAAPADLPASAPALTGTITRIEAQGRNTALIVVDDRPGDAANGRRVRVLPSTRIVRRSGHIAITAADLKTGEQVGVWFAGGGEAAGGTISPPAPDGSSAGASRAGSAAVLMLEDVPGRRARAAGPATPSRPPTAAPPAPPPAASPAPVPARDSVPDEPRPPAQAPPPAPSPPGILLRAVRLASHADFDRVVFEFSGDVVPAHEIVPATGAARQCGSGQTVAVAGSARLEVRLTGCEAHDEAGRPTVSRDYRPDYPAIREIALTCDFEGHVTWVLGMSARRKYEARELRAPARLVIDVPH